MANTLKTLPKDGTWTELTAGGVPATSFAFANLGPASIYVQYGVAGAPAASARGILYKPGHKEKTVTPLQQVWARVELADAVAGSIAEVSCQVV